MGRSAGYPAEASGISGGGIDVDAQMLRLSLASNAEPNSYQRFLQPDASGDRPAKRVGRRMSFYDQVNTSSRATRSCVVAAA